MLKNEILGIMSGGNRKEYQKFGIMTGMVFGFISILLFWKSKGSAPYFLGMSVGLIILGWIIPQALKYLHLVWMSFAVVMGYIMSRLILTLLYFMLFAPVGVVTRIVGKDLLKEKWDKNSDSYWIKRDKKPYDSRSAENQF